MKQSLRIRLVILFASAIIISVSLIWCINFFLLNVYYEKSKIEQMKDVYNSVEQLCKDVKWGTITAEENEKLVFELDGLSSNNGVNIYVASVYYDVMDFKYPKLMDWQARISADQLFQYIDAKKTGKSLTGNYNLLYSANQYNVYKIYDERVESNYIELISKVSDATWIYVRTNYQNMQESANISSRLLTYVGLLVTLIGIFVMYFVSKGYTKPIMRLVNHAKKMTELDFNARYDEQREDEIGILGSTMNTLSDKLEKTISELKTANNELQIDIARKQELEDMRTEFLANVSHELKTPLALIQGYAEGLQDNINDDEQSREFYCEVIIDEANKMNKMVKKLLSLNQLEFGNDQVHMEHFDIMEMLESKITSNEILIKQKEVSVSFSSELPRPSYVWADEYMIDEVITNYVSNALNHVEIPENAETGEKVVEIKAVLSDGKIRISVFNTGKPILQEDISKIWGKFYKVDKARTREYGGNGIGLSIVKAVMEAHNQSYGVKNYDNGVEFWFELECENVD